MFALDDRRITVDGLSAQYLEAGTGAPLVLLHRHARSDRLAGVIPALARTHRVPALSLPGHSGTAVTVSAYAPGRDTTPPTRRGILDPQAHLPRRGVRP